MREAQASRILAFAAHLHAALAAQAGAGAATATRMGAATGDVAFLMDDAPAATGAGFLCIQVCVRARVCVCVCVCVCVW